MSGKLRIAIFAREFPAPSETFVLDQVTGLLDLGHEVTVFADRPSEDSPFQPEVTRHRLDEQTRYLRMPRGRTPRLLLAPRVFLRILVRRPDVALRCLNVWRYGREALSLRLLYWSDMLYEEKSFDIIHCHFGPVGNLAAKLRDAGAISGRLGTAFHGVDVSAYVRDRPDYYRFLFEAGDLFLPVSEAWCQRLLALGCDPGRTVVHHMGVATECYPFRARRRDPNRPLRILTAGRMIEKKGIAYGLRAVATLKRRGVPVRYTLVGDGALRDKLEDFARALGLGDTVTFLGWQDRAEVARHMDRSDLLLLPSVTASDGDQEGIPVTLMEAMASGLLVVATAHSGIPELVVHEQTGLLVRERDSEALAQALVRLIGSAEDWPAMSHAARRRVLEHFEVRQLTAELVRLYEKPASESTVRDDRTRTIAARFA